MKKSRVLVLGGAGFVGREVVRQLDASGFATPVVASRHAKSSGAIETVQLNTLDSEALARVMVHVDAVVNCVAGEGRSISDGAAAVVKAANAAGTPRIIHMSTMSVYGSTEGTVTEAHPVQDDLGWYGHAKIEAEKHILRYAEMGGEAVILRPGCVVGIGSRLWVDRIASWLKAGRLGDLGRNGDGPANLVDVRDVARAALHSLSYPLDLNDAAIFNLAAPDGPRWNQYFSDLALRLGATPVKTMGLRRMKLDAYAIGIPMKVLEKLGQKILKRDGLVPEAIPPSLLGLWQQQITLNSEKASSQLEMPWTSYQSTIDTAFR